MKVALEKINSTLFKIVPVRSTSLAEYKSVENNTNVHILQSTTDEQSVNPTQNTEVLVRDLKHPLTIKKSSDEIQG